MMTFGKSSLSGLRMRQPLWRSFEKSSLSILRLSCRLSSFRAPEELLLSFRSPLVALVCVLCFLMILVCDMLDSIPPASPRSSLSSPDTMAFRVFVRLLWPLAPSVDFRLGILCRNTFFMQFIFIQRVQSFWAKPHRPERKPRGNIFRRRGGKMQKQKNNIKSELNSRWFWPLIIISHMEEKQKEENLRKYLQGLFLTDREVGALNALSDLARWFVKERREDRYIKLLKSEYAKARPSQSKTLIRTLYLIDKLVKQSRSFRQPAALVITQIFVELFSIFFQTDSIREMQQMKKLRKRWVTIFPDEVLIKIRRQIQHQFNYNLDSGFSDKMTQELKQYYTKDLKLTPQQIAKYLPESNSPKNQRKSRSRESSLDYDEPTKRSDPYGKRQPEVYGDHLMPPGQMHQPVQPMPPSQPPPPQQMPIPQMSYGMPPHDPYQRYGYAPPPDQGQMGRYPAPMYANVPPPYPMHPMSKQSSSSPYMVYPPHMGGYPPNYYMGYPMDPYYQNLPPQQQQQQQYPPPADYNYGVKYEGGARMQEMRKEQPPTASSGSTPGSTLSSAISKSKSSSEAVLEKLRVLRQGSQRCPMCGLRSHSRESFEVHLKSHFLESKRSYEICKKNNPAVRQHLLSLQAWLSMANKSSEEEYILDMHKATDTVCKLCSNPFKATWDPSLEKFVYRNVVNVQMDRKALVTLHYCCYNALQEEETPNQSDAVNG